MILDVPFRTARLCAHPLTLVAALGLGISTPAAATAHENRTVETREVFLAEHGPGRVVERGTYRGTRARGLRAAWDGASHEQIVEELSSYAEGTYGSSKVNGVVYSALDEPGSIELELEVVDAEWAATDFDQGFVVVTDHDALQALPHLGEEKEERSEDFLEVDPHQTEILYRVHVPDGFVIREVPEDRRRSLGPATLTHTFEAVDGEVHARIEFRLDEGRLSPDQVAALREGIGAFYREDPLVLWFDDIAARHVASGRIDEAIAESRRLLRAHPTKALHTLRLTRVIRHVGLFEEARRLARRATEMEPKSPLAHALLGELLLFDEMGRWLSPGFDREGALSALRRARDLDPENLQTALHLATALEYDADGVRYADAEGLREAIEIYRSIDQEELAGTDYEHDLPLALLHADRPWEAVELLENDAASAERYALLVAAEAMANGADAAIERAERWRSDAPGERAAILGRAAQHLVPRRRYPEAAKLVRTAARIASTEDEVRDTIELFETLRRYEEISVNPDDPAGLLRSLIVAVAKHDGTDLAHEVGSRMASDWYRGADRNRVEALLDVAGHLTGMAAAGRSGLTPERLLDFGLSLVHWTVEARPSLGFLVTAESRAPGHGATDRSIVVRRGDRLLLAGSDRRPRDYGRYAYELARDGDLERARALLEHALAVTEAANEDDTLLSAGGMLHAVWPPGNPEAPDAARFAGAVLASEELVDNELVEFLRDIRVPPEHEMARLQALARARMALEDWDGLLEVGRTIYERNGEGLFVMTALQRLERHDDLADFVIANEEGKAVEGSDDLDDETRARQIARARALAHLWSGRLESALEAYAALAERENEPAFVYDRAARLAIVTGAVDEQTVAWARRAVEEAGDDALAQRYTLATALAERGETIDAYDTLLRTVEESPELGVQPHEWYVLGRIAEHHGFPRAARESYRRAAAPNEDPLSAHALAQRRLHALDDL